MNWTDANIDDAAPGAHRLANCECEIGASPVISAEINIPSFDVAAPADFLVAVRHPIDDKPVCTTEPIFHSIKVWLSGLKASYQARIRINATESTVWDINDRSQLVGVSIKSSSPTTPADLRSFVVNRHEFFICVHSDCDQIEVELYVQSAESMLRGSVELPQGGSVTVGSDIERTTLTGLSSFSIALPEVTR